MTGCLAGPPLEAELADVNFGMSPSPGLRSSAPGAFFMAYCRLTPALFQGGRAAKG